MKMLGPVFIIAVVLCASTPVFAELSVADLEKIRQVVNESEVRLEKRIDEVKKTLETRIEDQGKRITILGDRITDLRERINFQGNLIIALIITIITFVAVPMGIIVYQYNRQRDQREAEIKALRQRIEELERKPIIQA